MSTTGKSDFLSLYAITSDFFMNDFAILMVKIVKLHPCQK